MLRDDGKWTELSVFTSSSLQKDDMFGYSVAMSGNVAVVSAPGRNNRTGSAFIFQRASEGEKWIEMQEITSSVASLGVFLGNLVSMDGNVIVINSPFLSDATRNDVGGAVVFELIDGTWKETAYLVPSQAAMFSFCGSSGLVVDKDVIWIGCSGDSLLNQLEGVVYAFTRNSVTGQWEESLRLTASSPIVDEFFGSSIAIHDNLLAIGAYGASTEKAEWTGAVYLYSIHPTTTEKIRIMPDLSDISVSAMNYYYFGSSIAVTDDRIIVGAYGDTSTNHGDYAGAAYLYSYDKDDFAVNGNVTLMTKIIRSKQAAMDRVGNRVVASGKNALLSGDGIDVTMNLADDGMALYISL